MLALIAVLSIATVAPVVAKEPIAPIIEPSIDGCGKAQAMIRAEAAQVASPVAAVMEPLTASDVLHYDLDIEVSNLNPGAESCTITGACTMTVQSKSAHMTEFTFRLRSQYNITGALINGTTPVTVQAPTTTTRVATLDRAYLLDEVFTLTIAYTGTTLSVGLGSIEVGTHGGTPVVATLSEPYYAYSWWPVKDGDYGVPGDNSDKATLDFSITAPNNYVVPANGVLTSVDTLSGNRKRYNWSTSYPISAYLVSFAATNYTQWTQTYNYPGGSMPVEFYIYPENDSPANRQGWENVLNMMAAFRPFYGEYPFINEKYGLYNFPFSGGMEHQTITGQSGFTESLTAHEVSHQWWGDNVTCRTWSDIWLNEGFATFSECLWQEYKTGSQNVPAYLSAMIARKPTDFSGTVYIPAAQTSSASRIFDSNLSYRKGAWVLHQLRHVVGDAVFFQILADYRAAFEGSAATTDDFSALASATYGQDLTWFFNQWVYQGGAPAYQYGWDSVNVNGQEYLHVRIRQTQPLPYPSVFIMPVDLRATIGGSPQTLTVWNDQRTQWSVVPVSGAPTTVAFDPEQWILRSSAGTIAVRVGDADLDNDVDADDFGDFASCYTGAGGTAVDGCEPVDFEGDGDVDCSDYQQFTTAWTAAGKAPDFPTCTQLPIPAVSTYGLIALGGMLLFFGGRIVHRRTTSG